MAEDMAELLLLHQLKMEPIKLIISNWMEPRAAMLDPEAGVLVCSGADRLGSPFSSLQASIPRTT